MHDRTIQLTATLPGAYYYAPEIFEREVERIWGAMWVCVERAEKVPAAGDFVSVDVAGESLLVVRGRDGEIRAFYNVCRHRGARISVEPCGTAKAFTCPYHAWSYSLDGSLQGAPNISGFGAFPREQYGLIPVAAEVWHGMIWLNLAADPPPLVEQLEPSLRERFGRLAQFERYNLGGLTLGKRMAYDVGANWKLIVENFMECYHCAPLHPEFCRLLPGFRNSLSHQATAGAGTAFADGVQQFTLSGNGDRPRLPGLDDEDDRLYFGLVLAPNVLLNLLPDHVIVHTVYPRGPQQSFVVCDWLFDPAAVAAPDFDASDTVAIFDLVNRQDWSVCERTQAGMQSRAYARGGVYVPAEQEIVQFNEFIRRRLDLE